MTTEDIYKHYSMSAAAVDVASLSTRSLYCPECHFKIQEVYDDCRKGHIQAKCRKCKKIVVCIIQKQYFESHVFSQSSTTII